MLNRKQPPTHQDLSQVDLIDQLTDQGDSEQPGNQAELAAKDLPPVIVTKPMEESSTEPLPIIINISTINETVSVDSSEHDSDDDDSEDRTKGLLNVNTASARSRSSSSLSCPPESQNVIDESASVLFRLTQSPSPIGHGSAVGVPRSHADYAHARSARPNDRAREEMQQQPSIFCASPGRAESAHDK